MPAITFGWILVDALNEEEAYKLVEEKLNIEGVEAVNDWQEELYYFNENITITTDSIEEYNELE